MTPFFRSGLCCLPFIVGSVTKNSIGMPATILSLISLQRSGQTTIEGRPSVCRIAYSLNPFREGSFVYLILMLSVTDAINTVSALHSFINRLNSSCFFIQFPLLAFLNQKHQSQQLNRGWQAQPRQLDLLGQKLVDFIPDLFLGSSSLIAPHSKTRFPEGKLEHKRRPRKRRERPIQQVLFDCLVNSSPYYPHGGKLRELINTISRFHPDCSDGFR